MIKKWVALWVTLTVVLGALLFWKNSFTYPLYSTKWRVGKSLADLVLILFAAVRLPALLIAWCVLWATRPIRSPGLRTTAAVIIGATLGLLASATVGVMEIVVLLSVFAIDLVTGKQGFIGYREQYRQQQSRKVQHDLPNHPSQVA
jgi:hypothetical protein